MKRVVWTTQNEETDDDGFLTTGTAAYEAERKMLAGFGCPETDKMVFFKNMATGRDESLMFAEVTEPTAKWLEDTGFGSEWDEDEHGLWVLD